MTTETGSLFATALVALWAASALLWFTRGRAIAGWLLTFLPASFVFLSVAEILKGKASLGRGTFETDERQLWFSLATLAVCVLSAVKWRWRWSFWAIWICTGLVCAVIVYLTFFWKVFS